MSIMDEPDSEDRRETRDTAALHGGAFGERLLKLLAVSLLQIGAVLLGSAVGQPIPASSDLLNDQACEIALLTPLGE